MQTDANAQSIVKWAERQQLASSRKPTKRLTQDDLAILVAMHKAGKSQVEIAEALSCSQQAVSKWVKNLTDSTDTAKLYLRGQALRMAQNIVNKGLPKDHVVTLKGLSVLEEQQHTGVTVIVGGGGDVKIGVLSPQKINSLDCENSS